MNLPVEYGIYIICSIQYYIMMKYLLIKCFQKQFISEINTIKFEHKMSLCLSVINVSNFFCRHVMVPKDIARVVQEKKKLMTETEWRKLGVQQSTGWQHYMFHEPGMLHVNEYCSNKGPQSKIQELVVRSPNKHYPPDKSLSSR
jgi:hypothetical protein